MTAANPERPAGRPATGEYLPYYDPYIRRVPDGDIVAVLDRQIGDTAAFFAPFTTEQARWRPAPKEWSVIEIVGHLADSERIFSYRALCIARNDPTPLPGADLEAYVPAAGFESRALADVVGEYVTDGTPCHGSAPAWLEGCGVDPARDGRRAFNQRARPRIYSCRSRDASCGGVAEIARLMKVASIFIAPASSARLCNCPEAMVSSSPARGDTQENWDGGGVAWGDGGGCTGSCWHAHSL